MLWRILHHTRFKLAALNTLFFFLIITGLTVYLYSFLHRTLYKEEKSFLAHESQELASMIKRHKWSEEIKRWFVEEISQKPEYAISFSVYSGDKKLLGSYGVEDLTEALPAAIKYFSRPEAHGQHFIRLPAGKENQPLIVAGSSVVKKEKIIYYVLLGSRFELIDIKMTAYRKKMFYALPALFVLSLAFGWVLTGLVLAPLRTMTARMETITIKGLDQRIQERGTGDELDRLAANFNLLMERIKQAYAQISQFTADAAHELKTPLAVMKNDIEVALNRPREARDYEELLASHLEELDRLSGLVNALLFLARADAGGKDLKKEAVPVELLNEVIDFFEPVIESKGLTIEKEIQPGLAVFGTPFLLRQLFFNLFDNAIKYNRPQGKILIEASARQGMAEILMEDSGAGIQAENLEKIFDRFYREDVSRSSAIPGHGLGLPLCKTITDLHQGTLQIESTPGKGTRVRVRLPLHN